MQNPGRSFDLKKEAVSNGAKNTEHKKYHSDAGMWDAFRAGDESAFIRIYKNYFATLVNYGLQFFQFKIDAEDIVQDLFIDLRLKRTRLPSLKKSLKVFLFVALKNKIIDYKRKEQAKDRNLKLLHQEYEFVLPIEDDLIKTQEYSEKLRKLNIALERLTSRQREALYYLYYENMTYEEIAILMHLNNVKSARNIIYKAFKIVKESFLVAIIYTVMFFAI